MKPLLVLLIGFTVSLVLTKLFTGEFYFFSSGRIAMAAMLLFTATGHFAFTKGMSLMLPNFIPLKKKLVYLTGIIEIAAALGLLIHKFQNITAWLLIVFFVAILPANIYAALKNIDYQKGTADGNGAGYLWFRIPLQILFIGWVYFFAILH